MKIGPDPPVLAPVFAPVFSLACSSRSTNDLPDNKPSKPTAPSKLMLISTDSSEESSADTEPLSNMISTIKYLDITEKKLKSLIHEQTTSHFDVSLPMFTITVRSNVCEPTFAITNCSCLINMDRIHKYLI